MKNHFGNFQRLDPFLPLDMCFTLISNKGGFGWVSQIFKEQRKNVKTLPGTDSTFAPEKGLNNKEKDKNKAERINLIYMNHLY